MAKDYRVIRDAVLEIVGSDIGIYLIGQQSVPAIMITPPEPTPEWRVNGLEVLIERNPKSNSRSSLSGERQELIWSIILNQWDKANQDTLRLVRNRLKTAFAPVTDRYQEQTATSYERCNLYIPVSHYHRRY
jgi:hypothetical protein